MTGTSTTVGDGQPAGKDGEQTDGRADGRTACGGTPDKSGGAGRTESTAK